MHTILGIVKKIVTGEAVTIIPWSNPLFQRELLRAITALRQARDEHKKDAADLAVIKSVFGGRHE